MSNRYQTSVADTCCFLAPGQILQTQFWDYDPSTGPSNSWTIHGMLHNMPVELYMHTDYP
jgi:hypothetical protein